MSETVIRILIVDDDSDDFVLTRDMLAEINATKYEWQWVSNFETALQYVNNRSFDLFIFDYQLGAHNGLELLEEVKKNGNRTPVILLTGQGDREIGRIAIKWGAYDYLTKNEINASLLERSIHCALERRKMEELISQEEKQAEVTPDWLIHDI